MLYVLLNLKKAKLPQKIIWDNNLKIAQKWDLCHGIDKDKNIFIHSEVILTGLKIFTFDFFRLLLCMIKVVLL